MSEKKPTKEELAAEEEWFLKLPRKEQEHLAEIEMCRRDRDFLFRRHRWIKDKAGKIRKIGTLKLAQRKVNAVIKYCRDKKMPVRICIGKSRKQGVSTDIAADCYEEVKNLQFDALIIAHSKDGVNKIFSIYQRFYKYDDMTGSEWGELQKPSPYKGKLNLREMRFHDHDGHITVATAKNAFAGTGETPQYIHASESAKWEKGEETLTSLNQAIGDEPGTTFIHESTFCGEEACFLPIWRAAYDNSKLEFIEQADGELKVKFTVTNPAEWNHFIPLFISVLDDEDARLKFFDDEDRERFAGTLDEYERHLVDHMNASFEFLNWRRKTIKLKCKNDIDVFKQEYPTTPEEAIRASGRPRFDHAKLDTMPAEDGRKGRLIYQKGWTGKTAFKPDPQDNFILYRDPVPYHTYVIGVDTAEGSSLEEEAVDPRDRLDRSVFTVLNIDTGNEQVAKYSAITTPEDLVEPLLMTARFFNNAFVTIERNSSGHTTCVKMNELYDTALLYHEDDWDTEKSTRSRAVGHKTTPTNRKHIISHLADCINQNNIVLHDKKTIEECKYFIWGKDGKPQAARGHHDDEVFALIKALIGIDMARQLKKLQARRMKRQTETYYQYQQNKSLEQRSYL